MKKKRLEYYSAEWCGPCKMYKPIIQELMDEGYKIEMIDIDKDDKRVKEKNIMSVPTTIIYKEDKEFERLVGVQPKEKIKYLMSE